MERMYRFIMLNNITTQHICREKTRAGASLRVPFHRDSHLKNVCCLTGADGDYMPAPLDAYACIYIGDRVEEGKVAFRFLLANQQHILTSP